MGPGRAGGGGHGATRCRGLGDSRWHVPSIPPSSPAVLQSQSVQALAQWLESQEDTMRQLRATSRQLWARLNASAERR